MDNASGRDHARDVGCRRCPREDISYHANGMVKQLTHANATKVIYGKDPSDMPRPASISLQPTASR